MSFDVPMTPLALEELRAHLPGCELIVYVDLVSRTVLGADGAVRYPQEYLDALCTCAATLFDATQSAPGGPFEHALFFGPSGGRAFFRHPSEPDEALACVCALDLDTDHLIATVRDALHSKGAPDV